MSEEKCDLTYTRSRTHIPRHPLPSLNAGRFQLSRTDIHPGGGSPTWKSILWEVTPEPLTIGGGKGRSLGEGKREAFARGMGAVFAFLHLVLIFEKLLLAPQ